MRNEKLRSKSGHAFHYTSPLTPPMAVDSPVPLENPSMMKTTMCHSPHSPVVVSERHSPHYVAIEPRSPRPTAVEYRPPRVTVIDGHGPRVKIVEPYSPRVTEMRTSCRSPPVIERCSGHCDSHCGPERIYGDHGMGSLPGVLPCMVQKERIEPERSGPCCSSKDCPGNSYPYGRKSPSETVYVSVPPHPIRIPPSRTSPSAFSTPVIHVPEYVRYPPRVQMVSTATQTTPELLEDLISKRQSGDVPVSCCSCSCVRKNVILYRDSEVSH